MNKGVLILIIRALEETDLHFVHQLNNEYTIMSYWFEEPYQSLGELQSLYKKHLLDNSERRFIIEQDQTRVGIVELVEIDFIHSNCEIQIIIDPKYGGKGYAKTAFKMAIDYAFLVLNLHKIYLYVYVNNEKQIHIYKEQNFTIEGTLLEHFYTSGDYSNCHIMGLLKKNWVNQFKDDLSYVK